MRHEGPVMRVRMGTVTRVTPHPLSSVMMSSHMMSSVMMSSPWVTADQIKWLTGI